mmetsp:Transcript_115440/g.172476  ORF Transcript_115440/g.172476 Transcript_115440/m.172476 type:complete len:318 (-) Transcript_115440:41-994(-)|eukprot:CAMPEP_0117036382 /NCGR_PEP_ID=MMETSP0472-20121206/25776_1 /TAXON_ID=693140 ORGANISM="Tiarina fusus, Strain LIS" /NCGR_SAMPLE_ID=MMETSP0472 /ASSEMBLY_ACC=CAM_ASM_000603 /LENGTH=317 /DNA_ID=CAMNT_0004746123 /DNA_START=199 /DNA_END=1152 /DNA_ORIENTATION=-
MNPGARRFSRHVPAVAAVVTSAWTAKSSSASKCEAPPKKSFGMVPDAEGDFHNLFPKRQLWQPKVEYPLWDANWDDRKPTPTGNEEEDRNRMRQLRKDGVTRHIILVRHGQYDETERDDEKRLLTELGRKQADLTGRRLKVMMDGASEEFGPCNIKVVHVSNMARAKETADIIASHLPGVPRSEPNPNLNEGRPSHNIPGGRASAGAIEKTDENHPRIEQAFRELFYRAPPPDEKQTKDKPKHEFEIVVCHANVIRYFLCRGLQIPPEAWLRLCTFNCSLTYLTIRPTGTVSCRMLGDMGHIPYGMSTFSMHPGYNW